MLMKKFLQCIHLADAAEAFDGLDVSAVCLHRKHQARSRAVAVEKHGARAADAVLAADMRAGEPERVTQKIGEQESRLDGGLVG